MNTTCIEEKFKDCPPQKTIQNIKECLEKVNVELEESIKDAGVGHCYSVHVKAKDSLSLFSNGKGVTPDLARASGYAEFIERIQCGLLLYKYQSIHRDPEMWLQTYAPDGKYMTTRELIDNGEWMDHIIAEYGTDLTREKLAEQCRMYECTDDDKILTLPFYSIFEDKYVYLPAAFVEHMYSTNGCCAGNSRNEAWVHALSEILERNSMIRILSEEKPAPIIPMEVVNKYTIPKRILAAIQANPDFDITIYDFSGGKGYPVVGTLLINKRIQDYVLNISADPVLEIALSRGLTEIMQGRSIDSFHSFHSGNILLWDSGITKSHNIVNQYETGNGLISINFFAQTADENETITSTDNSTKNNSELLDYALGLFKNMGRSVYVRNYSYLGFNSYMFVIPGFSEVKGMRLTEKIQEYGLGDAVYSAFRNPAKATVIDLNMMLMYFTKLQDVFSRRSNFSFLSGLPMKGNPTTVLLCTTVSYAAYKLGRYGDAARYLRNLLETNYKQDDPLTETQRRYLQCLYRYLDLKSKKATPEQIKSMLTRFFYVETVEAFYDKLENGRNIYEEFLLKCDTKTCTDCAYRDCCDYNEIKDFIKRAGKEYSKFTDGQIKENFTF